MKRRDSQANKIYRAGNLIADGFTFDSLPQVQEYVNGITKSNPWQAWGGQNRVLVTEPKQDGFASSCRTNRISLPQWAWNERVILHELAHLLTYKPCNHAPHDASFAGKFLQLIGWQMGTTVQLKLIKYYGVIKVKYHTE